MAKVLSLNCKTTHTHKLTFPYMHAHIQYQSVKQSQTPKVIAIVIVMSSKNDFFLSQISQSFHFQ